ncbi:MAG TPA: type II 3-dehydroquinate dehydratase [Candidatus Dormibacteraeota bacterium]
MTRVLVLNGPNLGSLGRREPDIYGTASLADVERTLLARANELGVELRCEQSNHEGRLLDLLEEEAGRAQGVVVNPGALSHTSIALLDAMRAFPGPVVEVHISNIHAREPFRARSRTGAGARGVVTGLGVYGYALALEAVTRLIAAEQEEPSA